MSAICIMHVMLESCFTAEHLFLSPYRTQVLGPDSCMIMQGKPSTDSTLLFSSATKLPF